MYYFAQLKFDPDGRHVVSVDLVRQTSEYRDRKVVKVQEVLHTHETLGAALAEARKLNRETA